MTRAYTISKNFDGAGKEVAIFVYQSSYQRKAFEVNMSSLRNFCNALLVSHSTNLINDEEFLMLYDHNTSKNPDFPY